MTNQPQLPQDVEEFIAEKQTRLPGTNFGMVMCEDLRAWMSGHVRVPVELLRKRFESPNTIEQCEAEAEFLALLNASKGEGK